MIERTNVSDIKEILCDDGEERFELNNSDKIIRWIKYKLEEQTIEYQNQESHPPLPIHQYINLSNCAISTTTLDDKPSLTNLCDILEQNDKREKLDFLNNNGYGNKYYHEVKIEIECKNSIIHSAFFHHTKFYKYVDFESSIFKGYCTFSNCLFEEDTSFQGSKFIGLCDFSGSEFKANVFFHNAIFDTNQIHFNHSIFRSRFLAQNLEFVTKDGSENYIQFKKAQFFKDVDFSYTNFDRVCSFDDSKILGNIHFQKSHFNTSVDFFNAEIEGSLLFSPSPSNNALEVEPNIINQISFYRARIGGRIDFENCEIDLLEASFANIQKGALFRIYKSKVNSLDFTSVQNDGIIILENNQNNIDEITFESAINTGTIEIENTEAKTILDRKTARLLKNSANKSGNTIDGLNYKAKEMALYQKELTSKIKPSLRLKALLSNLLNSITRKIILSVLFAIPAIIIASITHQVLYTLIAFLTLLIFIWTSIGSFLNEMTVLMLNTISNKNGLSWFRGLTFTLTVWVLFYGIFIMSRDGIGDVFFLSIEENREGFIKYLWLPSGLNDLFLDNTKTISAFAITIFILGKIAIAYGIYQTITAFRKYKN